MLTRLEAIWLFCLFLMTLSAAVTLGMALGMANQRHCPTADQLLGMDMRVR